MIERRKLRHAARVLAIALPWAWSAGAIAFAPYATPALRGALALLFLAALPLALWRGRLRLRWLAVLAFVPGLACHLLAQPSNQRDWNADQDRLATARIDGDRVRVSNVRNFRYRGVDDFDARWEDRDYDLSRLESLWFIVEPFSGYPGAAHTFLSFGFDDGRYLAVSAEIRKEKGESFSPWKGLYRNYELTYVLGDERDLVHLRTQHRRDTVYAYPVRATKAQVRTAFVDMLARTNALAATPEFYHSATNTCTTNIVDHANRIEPGLVPFSWKMLLPGHSDALALDLGVIDFDGDLAAARERFRVNERAAGALPPDDFSARIRRVE